MKTLKSILKSIRILGPKDGIKKILYTELYRYYSSTDNEKSLRYLDRKHEIVLSFLKRYVYQQSECITLPQRKQDLKNIVWVFWWQGEDKMPEPIKRCVKSIIDHSKGFEVITLNKDNIIHYIDVPKNILKLVGSKLTIAQLSDLLRVALLSVYGGGWIDAALYLTSDLPKDINNFSYYTIKNKFEKFGSISSYRWTNGFIFAEPNNPLIVQLYKMFAYYWLNYKEELEYFMLDYCDALLYECDNQAKHLIDIVPITNTRMFNNGLFEIWNELYNEDVYKQIIKDTWCHRLTYKCKYLDNPNTYYHKVTD